MSDGTETLYVVWPRGLRPPDVSVPSGYALRTTRGESEDRDRLRELLASGGRRLDTGAERALRDAVLPNGLFFAVDERTGSRRDGTGNAVGVCAALHNPREDAHYFPFGGELDALAVRTEHRRQGLGRALAAAAVRRLRDAGYRNVRAGVDADRLPAVRLLLNLGFRPFVVDETGVGRWRRAYDRLGLVFDPAQCIDAETYHTRSR